MSEAAAFEAALQANPDDLALQIKRLDDASFAALLRAFHASHVLRRLLHLLLRGQTRLPLERDLAVVDLTAASRGRLRHCGARGDCQGTNNDRPLQHRRDTHESSAVRTVVCRNRGVNAKARLKSMRFQKFASC